MSRPIPFSDLLDALHARGHPIGVHDYEALARLVARYDGASRDEFRTALVALYAKDEAEVERVKETFDELYPEVEPSAMSAQDAAVGAGEAPQAQPLRRLTVALIALAGAAALALIAMIAVAFLGRGSTARPTLDGGASSMLADAGPVAPNGGGELRAESERCPDPPPAVASRIDPTPVVAGALALIAMAGFAFAWRRRQAWSRRIRRAFARRASPGLKTYDWRLDDVLPRPGRALLSDVAGLLGYTRSAPRRDQIDVRRTVDLAARRGFSLDVVWERCRAHDVVIVLHDLGHATSPWSYQIDALVDGLTRAGVPIEHRHLDEADVGDGATPAALRDPGDAAVIVIYADAEARRPADRPAFRDWLTSIPAAHRVWLDPLAERAIPGRHADATANTPVWPLSDAGLLAAAWELSLTTGRPRGAPPADASIRAARDDAAVILYALLAMAPRPTLELAHVLLARFPVDLSPRAILELAPRLALLSTRIDADPDAARARAWLRAARPDLERQARRLYLELLLARKPSEDSLALKRWRLDYAIQLIHLAETERQIELARATLVELAKGDLRDEVLARMARECEEEGAEPARALLDELGKLPDRGSTKPVAAAAGLPAPRVWRRPHAGLIVGLAAAATALWLVVDGGLRQPDRRDVAYAVELRGTEAWIRSVRADAPASAEVFLDGRASGQRIDGITDVPIRFTVGPKWREGCVQLRSAVTGDRVAVSAGIRVRDADPMGTPAIDAGIARATLSVVLRDARGGRPIPGGSARIERGDQRIHDGPIDGKKLEVDEGVWTVTGYADEYQSATQSVTVRPGVDTVVEISLAPLAPDEPKPGFMDVRLPPYATPRDVKLVDEAGGAIAWNGGRLRLAPGRYRVELESPYADRERRRATVREREQTTVDLAGTRAIYGLAVFRVQPPEVEISLGAGLTLVEDARRPATAQDGPHRYVVVKGNAGPKRIVFRAPGFVDEPRAFTLVAAQTNAAQDVRLARTQRLQVQVRIDGVAARGETPTVLLVGPEGERRSAKTGDVVVVRPGTWTGTTSVLGRTRSESVVVTDVETMLTIEFETATITFELPEGMDPSDLEVEGRRWDGQPTRRVVGERLRLTSRSTRWRLEQIIEVVANDPSIPVKATRIGPRDPIEARIVHSGTQSGTVRLVLNKGKRHGVEVGMEGRLLRGNVENQPLAPVTIVEVTELDSVAEVALSLEAIGANSRVVLYPAANE